MQPKHDIYFQKITLIDDNNFEDEVKESMFNPRKKKINANVDKSEQASLGKDLKDY